MEAVPSEFNLFEKPVFQNSILEEYDEAIDPTSTLQEGSPITFSIPAVSDLYRDLNNSMLHVKCKIANANGTNAQANVVGPVNLTIHSPFANVKWKVRKNWLRIRASSIRTDRSSKP